MLESIPPGLYSGTLESSTPGAWMLQTPWIPYTNQPCSMWDNSKSYSFPRISEFKKAKTFSLYQPQTSVSSHLPSVRNCQYLLRSPSNSAMTLLCHQFTGPGGMLSIFRHLGSWSRLGSVGTFHIKYCKQFIDICPRHLEWWFWRPGALKKLATAEVSAKNY